MHKEEQARFEVELGINNCLIVRDTHSSDLSSLTKHALGFLEQQADKRHKRTLIISDIDADEMVCEMYYNNICQVIKSQSVDRFIFIGTDLAAHSFLFNHPNIYYFSTVEKLLSSHVFQSLENEAVLLKVRQQFHPELIEERLQLLAHDTVMETNFDAMFHNLDYFRTHLKPTTKLMCMVKASAYGAGSVEVAQALEHYGIDYLAVAFVNEGSELRQAGINIPILVLDPMMGAIEHIFKYKLEPEVCCMRFLSRFLNEAQKRGLRNYPIHLKIDTGMHRAGFTINELPEALKLINSKKGVKVQSIFSHLAQADETNTEADKFTVQQIGVFKEATELIENTLGYTAIKHILNTAGIDRFSHYQFDMVRLGIGLWGMNCTNQDKLRNVCSLSTRIMQIKELHEGDTVGYGRKGMITKPTRIALLPIGYADGLDRRLGCGVGHVYINNVAVPIVGNICMDLTMVDVTNIDVNEGDRVIIFDDKHPIWLIAQQLNTIPYEVLTSISPRVRRLYFRK